MTAPQIDPAAIRSHVEMLHGLAKGVDGILTLTRIVPTTEKVAGTERFAVGDVDNMVMAIEGWSRQPFNLYMPWSAFRKSLERGSAGGEADVVASLAFVGDLDADNGKAGNELPLPAPYVIETSSGNAQPVFPLARALAPSEAKPIAVALSDAIGADTRTQDISGLWRIPGTLNWPTKKKLERGRPTLPQQVKIKQQWTGELLDPEVIWEKVSSFARQQKSKTDNKGNTQCFNDLKSSLKKLIASPAYPDEDESETAASVITQLFWLEWSDGQIETVILDHPKGIGARYVDRGKDLEADIARLRKKFDKGERDSESETIDPVDLWGNFEPPSLSKGVLPDVIERFAIDQGTMMGADLSGVAVSAIAVCAAAIPDRIQVQVKQNDTGWCESARLWVALVGAVSAMKSPIMRAATRPIRRIDGEMARAYQAEMSRFMKLSAEERRQSDQPKRTRLVVQDTTIEAVQEILRDSPDGVLLYHDELSGFFGSMDKYSGARGAAKDRAFWLEAYNGAPYSVSRVGRGEIYIEHLSVNILGGIQPEPIRKIADDSMDDGLLQRLLPVMLRPAVFGRDESPSSSAGEYAKLIDDLHRIDNPMLGRVQTPTLVRFSIEAQAVRQDLERRHLEIQQGIEIINRKLAGHIGKYNGIFARLCLTFHCIEHAGQLLPDIIAEDTAKRARAFLHGFLLPHAIAFYSGVLGLSNDQDRLSAVAGYILAHKLTKVTNRDVQRGDRTMRRLEKRKIESVLDQLDALGWVVRAPGTRPSDPPHWMVNPAVHIRFEERAKSRSRKLLSRKNHL